MPSADEVVRAIALEAQRCLGTERKKIDHCLNQLNDEQIWWRPEPTMNSIGNLLLHLSGNLEQWLVCGLSDAPDHRDREAEFAERGPLERRVLLEKLDATLTRVYQALDQLQPDQLLTPITIQGFEVSRLGAIFDSVPHFKGHVQEIISFTRMQLGSTYRFNWEPPDTSP